MALDRLTKITGPGIATDHNWVGNNAKFTGVTTTGSSFNVGVTTIHSTLIEAHNIKSTGIITATGGSFSGNVTATGGSFSGNVTAVDGTFTGNVSIAGTLTYEDVTNIDSVGIITAPAVDIDDFLDVGSNIKLGNAGVITATSFVGSGAALTGIDATAIKDSGGNVKIQAQASGAIHTGVSTFQDLTVEKSGNLNVNIKSTGGWGALEVGGATAGYIDIKKPFSDDYDLRFMVDGSGTNYITSNAAPLKLNAQGATGIELGAYGAPSLKYNNDTKLTTTIKGIQVGTGVTIETNGQATYTGIITATAFKLADGSAIGAGAGGTWSTYTAGIATSKSVGVNTSNLDDNDLVGVGNSFQGLYISNGMIIHDNTLSGNHYIGTAFNGLMAGPVNIEGTLTIDGNYVVV